ncbi:class 3 lipase [Oleiphilus messinensis]|uniref:Class 3 lipase n=1 Tax=Oleiphilus messinensis TaxID=141451 RepID=A0A1Y0IBA5_9GAMM|nr:hypothetical protein [Oleiphilus messinensis]ARU56673.1 class 3 lipase [Oleiphilus messinensis]
MAGLLETLVGVVGLFFILSLMVTAITEIISQALNIRGKCLKKTLIRLLDEQSVNDFYQHRRIKALQVSSDRLPSYIPEHVVVDVVLDLLLSGQYPEFCDNDGTLKSKLAEHLSTGQEAWRVTLNTFYREEGQRIDAFRTRIEVWFNDSIDRSRGWFRRQLSWYLLFSGLILAILLNANAISLFTSFSGNDGGLSPDLGWSDSAILSLLNMDPKFLLHSAAGWLITAIGLTLGAPFWFDLLQKIVQIRAALRPGKGSASRAAPKSPVTHSRNAGSSLLRLDDGGKSSTRNAESSLLQGPANTSQSSTNTYQYRLIENCSFLCFHMAGEHAGLFAPILQTQGYRMLHGGQSTDMFSILEQRDTTYLVFHELIGQDSLNVLVDEYHSGLTPVPWLGELEGGQCATHRYYLELVDHVWAVLDNQFECLKLSSRKNLVITGWSTGAVVATLIAERLVSAEKVSLEQIEAVVTFSASRYADQTYQRYLQSLFSTALINVFHVRDVLPLIPSANLFGHAGSTVMLNDFGGIDLDPVYWFQNLNKVEFSEADLAAIDLEKLESRITMQVYSAVLKQALYRVRSGQGC